MENIAFKRACNLSTNHELSTISHIWFEENFFRKDNFKGLYEIKTEAQEEVKYLAPWPFRLSATGRNKYPSIKHRVSTPPAHHRNAHCFSSNLK